MAEFKDKLFAVGILTGSAQSIKDVLNINPSGNGHVNAYANGSTVVINSDRLILNAKNNHVFLCGKEGVTISSPKSIHIDCTDDLYMFSETGEIYLGLPNKGSAYDFDKQKLPKTKAEPTKNYQYEPLLLGLKTANLIEDLLSVLIQAVIRTPAGDGYFSKEMMYNFECLRSRLPEILSTAVFIDGVSHDKEDPAPPIPEEIAASVAAASATAGTAGTTTSGDSSSATGTNINNTQAPATNTGTATTPSTNPDGKV